LIAIDTDLLVYAHRAATLEHRPAQAAIEAACNSRTRARAAASRPRPLRSSTPEEAAAFLRVLQEEGGLAVWSQGPQFADRLLQTAADLDVRGVRVFDLQIAICALDGGATELWTHDRGFVKVPGLRIRDPLS
jgi:predicted nucleic acid-binding protein